MNDIKIFQNPAFGQVRTMTDEKGNPWFVGNEIATLLGYNNHRNAIFTHVDGDDKLRTKIKYAGQMREVTLINESGVYSLILSSRLPQAKAFKNWITSEILPQIRKTGGYIPLDKEDDEKLILSKAILILQRTIEQKDSLIKEQAPKVAFADAITASEDSILIGDLAKVITQNCSGKGLYIGRKTFFAWLREHGYLFKKETRPIQEWVERGIFQLSCSLISTSHGSREVFTTKVTVKGQQYFIEGFMSGRFRV